jgi:hypothetical protein
MRRRYPPTWTYAFRLERFIYPPPANGRIRDDAYKVFAIKVTNADNLLLGEPVMLG